MYISLYLNNGINYYDHNTMENIKNILFLMYNNNIFLFNIYIYNIFLRLKRLNIL